MTSTVLISYLSYFRKISKFYWRTQRIFALYFLISQETNGALGTLSISVSPGFLDYHDSNLKELSKDLHVFKVCAFALEL